MGAFILILDSQTAVHAAAEAINLCIRVVIPSLFPLFVFSILLTASFSEHSPAILRPVGRLLGLNAQSGSLLLTGFIGGYPTGAQCVANAHLSGLLFKQDAEKMLSYCSNAGPSFIFGIAGSLFENKAAPWLLWLIQILSAICVGILCGPNEARSSNATCAKSCSITEAIQKSIRAMAGVCSWILLFRCLLAYCEKWFLHSFPALFQTIFTGVLELTNGCWSLQNIANEQIRFILCAVFLSFGGICVVMQTQAVIGRLRISRYVQGKVLQAALALIMSLGLSFILYANRKIRLISILLSLLCIVLLLFSMILLQKSKKEVAFPISKVYNNGNNA